MSTVSVTKEEVATAPRRPRSTIVLGEESVLAPKAGVEVGFLRDDLQPAPRMLRLVQRGDQEAKRLMSEVADSSLARARAFEKSKIAWTQAGFACLTADRLPEAQEAFLRAIEIDPSTRNSQLGLARTQFELGKSAWAEQTLRSLLARHPRDTEILVSLGVVLASENRLGEALDLLESASISERDRASFFAMRGGIRVALGRFEAAVGDLRKAVHSRPEWVHVRNSLGVAEFKLGHLHSAERQFMEAARVAPLYEESFVNLLRLKLAEARFSEILDSASEDYKPSTASPSVARIIAAAALELKQWRVAQTWLESSLNGTDELQTRARLLNDLGAVHSRMGDQLLAGEYFERSLGEYPTELAFINRGKAFLLSNNSLLAVSWLQVADAFPESNGVERRKLLTNAYINAGEYQRALEEGRSLVREHSADRDVFILLTNILCDRMGNFSAATQVAEEGLREFPDDPGILNNIAYSHLMTGDTEAAMAYLDRAKMLNHESMFLRATRGLLLLKRGDIAAGRELYEEALAMAGTDAMRERVKTKRDLELARALLILGGAEKEAAILLARASRGGAAAAPYGEHALHELRRLRSGAT
jgi:tetratricopeptide (TPR) repeat protein